MKRTTNQKIVLSKIVGVTLVCLLLGLTVGSAVLAESKYYATKQAAVNQVPKHVEPKGCFVWKDGADSAKPWRVIPGTGCAHWVAHNLSLGRFPSPWKQWEEGKIKKLPKVAWSVCYDGFYIRIVDVIAGRKDFEIKNAKVGDIWTTDRNGDGRWDHCGIVREVKGGKVQVEHCSSKKGGVVKDWLVPGKEGEEIWKFWRVALDEPKRDVFMLVDLSSSFADDLPLFKAQAPDLMATLKSLYPDIRFGLGKFEDYPISPFGSASSGDKAYERLIDLTSDTDAVLSIITGLYTRFGDDTPESQLAALYQAATGAGQDLSGVGYPGASIPSDQQTNFRDGATKLFLLWTDAPFHYPGDSGSIPYPGPSFDETVNAILALDPPMVIGISSGGGGLTDLEAMAAATGALAPSEGIDINGDGIVDIPQGEPLVATIGYSGQGIAAAIESLVAAATVLPIADAGGPYTSEVGETIVFDGSNSFDADGAIVLYEWDFESDGVFDFSSTGPMATHAYSSEFAGVVTLRVTDNDGNMGTDVVHVEVSPPAPIADAGSDQIVKPTSTAGAEVTLDGSGSYDADGDPLTYTWTWDGGTATGVNPTIELPLGTTTITLVVNDGKADSEPDTVDITVSDCFIATAAYGTPMAEEIEILRKFRDEYLLTNPVGKGLVEFYYRVSPPIAEFITEHPSLKLIVRAGLVPPVAMSTIAVNTTPVEKTVIIGLLVLVSVALAAWAKKRRGKGPGYF